MTEEEKKKMLTEFHKHEKKQVVEIEDRWTPEEIREIADRILEKIRKGDKNE